MQVKAHELASRLLKGEAVQYPPSKKLRAPCRSRAEGRDREGG